MRGVGETFEITSTSGGARGGILTSPQGRSLRTPALLPVATYGVVKTLTPDEVGQMGFEGLIVNSFLIRLLEPLRGGEVDLHRYLNWDGVIFSDSGGFQLIRKGFLIRKSDEGILMKNPFDGREVLISPRWVVESSRRLKVDFGMVLDDCPPYPWRMEEVLTSTERTLKWAEESLRYPRGEVELLGIVQGGGDEGLRRRCSKRLVEMGYRGVGIGGLSVGEPKDVTFRMVKVTTESLPEGVLRYLMGVGEPLDILKAVAMGVDLFDSTYPARGGRHGTYLTPRGKVNLSSRGFRGAEGPIYEGCDCPVCRRYSRDFLYHLKRGKEMLLYRLGTLHNLHFMGRFMGAVRRAIVEGEFSSLVERRVSWETVGELMERFSG